MIAELAVIAFEGLILTCFGLCIYKLENSFDREESIRMEGLESP
jgi:hypothetical protein